MSLEVGTLVISTAGRDSDTVMAVIAVSEGYVALANGRKRRIDKPKSKKIKHVRPIGQSLSDGALQLLTDGKLTDKLLYSDIRQILMSKKA